VSAFRNDSNPIVKLATFLSTSNVVCFIISAADVTI